MAKRLDAYATLREQVFGQMSKAERGDPNATVRAVLQLVDADNPPLRLMLGGTFLPVVRATYADRLASWEAWESVSNAAQGANH